MTFSSVRLALGLAIGAGLGCSLIWHDKADHAVLDTLTAQHRSDSLMAARQTQTADSLLAVTDRLRQRYRALPAVTPVLTTNLALQDSLAQSRQLALESLVDATAGVDSLRAVIRRLVTTEARGDSTTHAVVEQLGRQLGEAGLVITQDSVSLTAMVAARDAERARAVSAEQLHGYWRGEAARAGRQQRMWQAATTVTTVLAVLAYFRH